MRPSLPKLFASGAAIMVMVAALGQLLWPNSAIDIHQHDTYYVIALFHIYLALAVCFLAFAGVYLLLPKISGRQFHYGAGMFHFVCSLLTTLSWLFPVGPTRFVDRPRRYYDYTAASQFWQYFNLNPVTGMLSVLFLVAQVVFVVNVLYCLLIGKREQSV